MSPISCFRSDNFKIFLSDPVAFQKPVPVVLFGLPKLLCFLSLGTKKYHSLSPSIFANPESYTETLDISISRCRYTAFEFK